MFSPRPSPPEADCSRISPGAIGGAHIALPGELGIQSVIDTILIEAAQMTSSPSQRRSCAVRASCRRSREHGGERRKGQYGNVPANALGPPDDTGHVQITGKVPSKAKVKIDVGGDGSIEAIVKADKKGTSRAPSWSASVRPNYAHIGQWEKDRDCDLDRESPLSSQPRPRRNHRRPGPRGHRPRRPRGHRPRRRPRQASYRSFPESQARTWTGATDPSPPSAGRTRWPIFS